MAAPEQGRIERRLTAILAADVAGYSRLMGLDEVGTAKALREHRAAIDPILAGHGGRIVKTTGDGLLVEFPSIVAAVEAAIAVQKVMADRNANVPEDGRMLFRIGINLGDVLIEGDDILGDGVNIAARLEGVADPGGICISASAFEHVRGKLNVEFGDLGEQQLKNIGRLVRAYSVTMGRGPAHAKPALALPDRPSIAVLPFQNMSGDPEQNYFADGIVEEIITALSRFRQLFVIARNSSFTYKGRTIDVKQVGRELGVRYVLNRRLFNHLVRAQQERLRDRQAQRLGGLEVYDQFDFRRPLDWQITRLLSFEKFPGVDADQTVSFRLIGSVAHQAAGRFLLRVAALIRAVASNTASRGMNAARARVRRRAHRQSAAASATVH
jgi:class 3 adenylate cyclase